MSYCEHVEWCGLILIHVVHIHVVVVIEDMKKNEENFEKLIFDISLNHGSNIRNQRKMKKYLWFMNHYGF